MKVYFNLVCIFLNFSLCCTYGYLFYTLFGSSISPLYCSGEKTVSSFAASLWSVSRYFQ